MITAGNRQEVKVYKKCKNGLKEQYNYLVKNREQLLKMPVIMSKGMEDYIIGRTPMETFWIGMGVYDMIDAIRPDIENSVDTGYRLAWINNKRKFTEFGLTFQVDNQYTMDYMKKRDALQLSDYKGSISATTKSGVINTVKNGVLESKSVAEIAKDITALNTSLFAPSRAELIAIQEVGQALGYGNHEPMVEVSMKGAVVMKKWSTVNDSRVRQSHMENEKDGWVPLNFVHNGTQEEYAPSREFRCRCTELYQIK